LLVDGFRVRLPSAIDLAPRAIDIAEQLQVWAATVQTADGERGIMKVTYYGHACFSVRISNKTLLFDPFITGNDLAKGIDPKRIDADYILISHGHSDHLGDAAEIARRTGATIVSNFEIVQWFGKQGLQKSHPLNHGGGYAFDFGRVKLVNAIHSSGLPDGSYGGNPGGFVITSADGNFYYSGDTALTLDMKLIGESTKLGFAALCLGDNFTMDVGDALKAAEFVDCKDVLGLHFDTFPPIRINHQAAIDKFMSAGRRLHLLRPGQNHDF
jgi:L-ascorbate metabolism protein UlaG (beta-lactamase superfamily)